MNWECSGSIIDAAWCACPGPEACDYRDRPGRKWRRVTSIESLRQSQDGDSHDWAEIAAKTSARERKFRAALQRIADDTTGKYESWKIAVAALEFSDCDCPSHRDQDGNVTTNEKREP